MTFSARHFGGLLLVALGARREQRLNAREHS